MVLWESGFSFFPAVWQYALDMAIIELKYHSMTSKHDTELNQLYIYGMYRLRSTLVNSNNESLTAFVIECISNKNKYEHMSYLTQLTSALDDRLTSEAILQGACRVQIKCKQGWGKRRMFSRDSALITRSLYKMSAVIYVQANQFGWMKFCIIIIQFDNCQVNGSGNIFFQSTNGS